MTLKNLVFAIFAACIGSAFQHGYQMTALSIPSKVIQNWIMSNRTYEDLEKNQFTIIWSTTISIFAIGGVFGGFLIGLFGDTFGRKGSLKFNNIIVLIAIALMTFSKNSRSYKMFIFGRFLAGVGAGLHSGLCPMYLIEISPDDIRGGVGSSYHCVVQIAVTLSHIAGYFLASEDNWKYIFIIAVGPAILQLVLLPMCPESPKFILITKEKDKQAEIALKWLRRQENVEEELELLKEEDNLVKQLRGSSLKRILQNPVMTNALICCLVFHIAQQSCGMNVQVFYTSLYEKTLGPQIGPLMIVGTTVLQLIGNVLAILYMDKSGRRKMMQISLVGMVLTTLLKFGNDIFYFYYFKSKFQLYLRFILQTVFKISYSAGLGPMPWFITAELLPHSSRSIAVCLTVVAHWLTNFVVSTTYLILKNEIGPFTTTVFVTLDLVFLIYLKQCLPETAKLSAIDIIKMYEYNLIG